MGSQVGGTGAILLQASEGISQTGGIIETDQLFLGGDESIESTGNFVLNSANEVNELAATLVNNLEFASATTVTVVKDDFVGVCDGTTESFTGLDIAGDLTLAIGGDLNQTEAPVQVDGLTTLAAGGTICLVGGDCDIDPAPKTTSTRW